MQIVPDRTSCQILSEKKTNLPAFCVFRASCAFFVALKCENVTFSSLRFGTFVRSPDVRAVPFLCFFRAIEKCVYPDFHELKSTHVHFYLSGYSRKRAESTLIKIVFVIFVSFQKFFVRSRVTLFRLLCVQNCLFSDFRAFIPVSMRCNFERTVPFCAFILVWTHRLFVMDLSLGSLLKRP